MLRVSGLNRKARRRTAALSKAQTSKYHQGKSAAYRAFAAPVAAGAIGLGASIGVATPSIAQTVVPPSNGPCSVAGDLATCTGDVSTGVQANGPAIETLNINNVTAPGIAPGGGTDGVAFSTPTGNVTLNIQTNGTDGIVTTGNGADGIVVDADGDGDVSITSTGEIATDGRRSFGIRSDLEGDGAISVNSTGNITTSGPSRSAGIGATQQGGDGDVSVVSAGRISTSGSRSDGIYANQDGGDGTVSVNSAGDISTIRNRSTGITALQSGGEGDVSVVSNGNISTAGNNSGGILGQQSDDDGDVAIQSTGNITTEGNNANAVLARQNGGDGDITVESEGNLSTSGNNARGIFARQDDGDGDITIRSTGNITTAGNNADGIFARQRGGDGDINVTSSGNISSARDGIRALLTNDGDITISNRGDVSGAAAGDGINATVNGAGDVVVDSIGDITGREYGIYGVANGTGNVTVNSNGNISAEEEHAIFADAEDGNVTVNVTGDVQSLDSDAIDVETGSPGGVIDVTVVGNITGDAIGIDADAEDSGDINIQVTGDIRAGSDDGIEAEVDGDGDISITMNGDIEASEHGIRSFVAGDGNISVEASGEIAAENIDGINAEIDGNGDVTISASGTIDAEVDGIFAHVTENGNISITNAASITARNDEGIDTEIFGDGDVFIRNSGRITSREDDAIEVDVEGSGDVSIVNSAQLTADSDAIDIELNGDGDARVTNSGALRSLDNNGIEVDVDGAGSITIVNTGNIDAFEYGIEIEDRDNNAAAIITNSARITGREGFSIVYGGDGNDTLNLEPGSILNGSVDFGNGNDGMGGTNPNDIDTLNFARGMNSVVNFADASGDDNDLASAPEVVNFEGAGVVANNGLTAVSVDTTGFAAQGTFISDLTDAVFNTIDTASPYASGSSGGQVSRNLGPFGYVEQDNGPYVWGSAFGGDRDVEEDGSNLGFSHRMYGFVVGAETNEFIDNSDFGVLVGYDDSHVSLDQDAGDTDITSYFGGVYLERDYGRYSLNAALLAGVTDNEATRNVDGGEAKGDFDGTFVSPSLSISAPINALPIPAFFSARASYVFLKLDEYSETGTAYPLTVEDRNVSLFNTRAQLNLPRLYEAANGSSTYLNWAVGVDATFDAGSDDVDAIVAATPFSFVASTEDAAAGFLGFTLEHTSADGNRSIGFSGEFQSTFGGGSSVVGELTASIRF